MGANESTSMLPYPPSWLPSTTTPVQHRQAVAALKSLSSVEPERFLAVRAPLPELEAALWDFNEYRERASAAAALDVGLNRLVYKCVPKRVPEAEFWRCFFCWAYHTVMSLGPAPPEPPKQVLSRAVLEAGDSTATSAIIDAFGGDVSFAAFAQAEMEDILKRDAEDGEKLAAGITMAVEKGVLQANPPVEPLTRIDVLGKTADAVCQEIIKALGDAPSMGCVLVLQGLSGTGKGTTCSLLEQKLPRCTSWSNGNVFRSLTLLAVAKCEKSGLAFKPEFLTPLFLAEVMACLSFAKHNGKFDIKIEGYGLSCHVSEVANTILKEPKVGKNIPTVAKMTQGEVVGFAAAAAEAMRADGMNVLMEGREQTLNYVRTPHRFELTLSEPLIIGKRRAAQRIMAKAIESISKGGAEGEVDVKAVLGQALEALTSSSAS